MRSGSAAASWLEQRSSYPLDEDGITQCMRSVLDAFGLIPIDGYGSAMDGWRLNGIPSTIANASFVRGTVHYFRGPFGHVAIATGRGTELRSTGVHTTSMLTATAADMARLTGDPYLGYSTSFSGTPIDFSASAGGGTTPFPDEPLPIRKTPVEIQAYYNPGQTHIAFGIPDPFDPIKSFFWAEYTIDAFAEHMFYNPVQLDNIAWNNRSNNKGRIPTLAALNAKLTAAGRPVMYVPALAGGGGSAPSSQQNADAVAAKLAPSFAAIPTAAQNGVAARAAIVK